MAAGTSGAAARRLFTALQEAVTSGTLSFPPDAAGTFLMRVPGVGNWLVKAALPPAAAVRELADGEDAAVGGGAGTAVVSLSSARQFMALIEGTLRPDAEWQAGRLTVAGDLRSLLTLRRLFEFLKQQGTKQQAIATAAAAAAAAAASSSSASSSAARTAPAPGKASAPSTPARAGAAAAGAGAAVSTAASSGAGTPLSSSTPVSKAQWAPNAAACSRCGASFSLLVRRHHCRYCGECVCAKCSGSAINGARACDACVTADAGGGASGTGGGGSSARARSAAGGPRPVGASGAVAASSGSSSAAPHTPSRAVAPAAEARAHRFSSGSSDGSSFSSSSSSSSISTSSPTVSFAAARNSSSAAAAAPPPPPAAAVSHVQASRHQAVAAPPARAELAASAAIEPLSRQLQDAVDELNALREHVAANEAEALDSLALRWTIAIAAGICAVAAFAYTSGTLKAAVAPTLALIAAALAAARLHTQTRRWILAMYAAGVVLLGLRAVRARTAGMSEAHAQPVWDAAHVIYARFSYKKLAALRAFWIKVAQYLSARADVLPPAYIRELSKLQDSTQATPFPAIKAQVEKELGAPLHTVFESFSETPIASASIAQVHRAVLKRPVEIPVPHAIGADGEPTMRVIRDVVVKVQHPGVGPIMRSDLLSLGTIVRLVAAIEPEYDFRPVISEWATQAQKELDFRREAIITRHVGKVLAAGGVHCRVPELIDVRAVVGAATPSSGKSARDDGSPLSAMLRHPDAKMATERVLIMEYIQGVKCTDLQALDAAGVDRQELLTDIMKAFALQMHVDGCFNGDPHSGNILVEIPRRRARTASEAPGAQQLQSPASAATTRTRAMPVLLDFGLTKVLPDAMRLAFCKMVVAATSGDAGALLDSFDAMGVRLNRVNPSEDIDTILFLLRDTAPPKQARANMVARREIIQDRIQKRVAAKQKKRPLEAFPPDLLFYLRVSELLHGLGASMHVSVPYKGIVAAYAEAALRCYTAGSMSGSFDSIASAQTFPYPGPEAAVNHVPGGGLGDVSVLNHSRIRRATQLKTLVPRPLPVPDAVRMPSSFITSAERAVYAKLRELWAAGAVTGCQVSVIRNGVTLVDAAFGELGPHDGRPVTQATLFPSFSVTKGVVSTMLHVLLERAAISGGSLLGAASTAAGSSVTPKRSASRLPHQQQQQQVLDRLGYTALVSAVWPSFAAAGSNVGDAAAAAAAAAAGASLDVDDLAASKDATSLLHVFTHSTGLQHAIPHDITMDAFPNLPLMVKAMEAAVPCSPPGSITRYHYYTFGWLAAGIAAGLNKAVRVVPEAEASVGSLLRRLVAEPLGVSDEMHVGVPEHIPADSARLAQICGSALPGRVAGALFALPAAGSTSSDTPAPADAMPGLARLIQFVQSAIAITAGSSAGSAVDTPEQADMKALAALLQALAQDRLYLLDARLFNRAAFRRGQIPAANGHFSARALARMYDHLGTILQGTVPRSKPTASSGAPAPRPPPLLSRERLAAATSLHAEDARPNGIFVQGANVRFGLGYQLFGPAADGGDAAGAAAVGHPAAAAPARPPPTAFGHSGLGGSIAFYDTVTNTAVAITVNQLSSDRACTRAILRVLASQPDVGMPDYS